MPEEGPTSAPGSARKGPLAVWMGAGLLAAVGALLVVMYLRFEAGLARGPQEFAYWPMPLEPLPYAPMRGFTFEQLGRHLGRLNLLGPALIALSIAVAALRIARVPRERTLERWALAGSILSLAVCGFVMFGVLDGRVIVDDEIAYRLQATLLSTGRLADNELPPFQGDAFQTWTSLGLTGKYLFGEPLVQVPGLWLGVPAALHLMLAALALWAWHRMVRGEAGAAVAGWSTLLIACSPMFILTGAIGLSHTSCLCCVVLAGYGLWRVREGSAWSGATVAASAIGFCAAVRLQVAVPAGLVLSTLVTWELVRRRRFAALAGFAGIGALWLAAILAYNHALSGSPFVLPWALYYPIEHYGFGYVWSHEGYAHTVRKAFENLGVSLVRFNGWWLGWPLSLGLLMGWALWDRRVGSAGKWLAVGAGSILFNFAYYSPGVSETGPVYYFEWLLPAAFLGGSTLASACQRWGGAAVATVAIHLLLGTTTFMVENVSRIDRLAELINEPAEQIVAHVEPPALLLYEGAADEAIHAGWVFAGFPILRRLDSDPVVIYPLLYSAANPKLRERYADRSCWYTRLNPKTMAHELYRCEQARELMARTYWDFKGPPLFYVSTAWKLGLIQPMESLKERFTARLTPDQIEMIESGERVRQLREITPELPLHLIRRNPGTLRDAAAGAHAAR